MSIAAARARAARLISICAPLLAIAFWAEPAQAYTWMIRHGRAACAASWPRGGWIAASRLRARVSLGERGITWLLGPADRRRNGLTPPDAESILRTVYKAAEERDRWRAQP